LPCCAPSNDSVLCCTLSTGGNGGRRLPQATIEQMARTPQINVKKHRDKRSGRMREFSSAKEVSIRCVEGNP